MQDEWDRMSEPERTEFIFQAITEVITMPTFQHAYLKGLDDTFNHVAFHMHEAFNKAPSAVTAEGIPVPYHVAEEMLQEAENPVQKVTEAAGTLEGTKAPVQMTTEGAAVTKGGNRNKLGATREAPQVASTAKAKDLIDADKIAAEGSYSGDLVKVPNPDAGADILAAKLKGQSCVKFSNDPTGKEFDVISNEFIAEAKPALRSIDPGFRKQAKRTFEAAKQTGRKVYFHFNGEPCRDIIKKLYEYQKRYGVEMIIDTEILY